MGAKALFLLVRLLLSVVYLLKSEPGLISGPGRGLYPPPEVSGHVLPVVFQPLLLLLAAGNSYSPNSQTTRRYDTR